MKCILIMSRCLVVSHRIITKWRPTLGLDYEYRLAAVDHMFGLVALVDAAFFDHRVLIYGAGLAIHPLGGLKILVASGEETSAGHKAAAGRLGLAYDFHIGSFSVAPTYNVDVIKANTPAHVVGLSLGIGL